jgi:exopolyphosphatase/guanosine-5'-triphosphate,3'-diphosphate pyrophosphatase
LHDVTWKAHPDYRAEVSFDYATRANLVGLDHQERIFLAVALIHRYKNKPRVEKLDELNALLSDEDQAQAETLGRAMRLGAMLGGPCVTLMGQLKLNSETLEWVIDEQSAELMGEVVENRLGTLAKALGKKAKLRIH